MGEKIDYKKPDRSVVHTVLVNISSEAKICYSFQFGIIVRVSEETLFQRSASIKCNNNKEEEASEMKRKDGSEVVGGREKECIPWKSMIS